MKTQEEIEKLAFKSYGDTLLKGSFIHGYTQCQEDMALSQPKELEPQTELLNFAKWYSGMEMSAVKRAYKRYLIENNSNN